MGKTNGVIAKEKFRGETVEEMPHRETAMKSTIEGLALAVLILFLATLSDAGERAPKGEQDHKVVTTSSGLQYIDLVVGNGRKAELGDTATVHYTGWLEDGTKFDSSFDRNEPFSFRVGSGMVIKGWDEGVGTMNKGGKRRLIIPPHLGYGRRGAGNIIPPNATLTFEVELIDLR